MLELLCTKKNICLDFFLCIMYNHSPKRRELVYDDPPPPSNQSRTTSYLLQGVGGGRDAKLVVCDDPEAVGGLWDKVLEGDRVLLKQQQIHIHA